MSACISTPVSWLTLERYALGELEKGKADVARHVSECAACAACLREIEADAEKPLPALPKPAPVKKRWPVVVAIGSSLALAAAVLLAIRSRPDPVVIEDGPRIKGDAFTFTLQRDDGASFTEDRAPFRDGDRFKAVVTCSAGTQAHLDVVVLDEAGASFPLAAAKITCGNGVPIPGAFRVTGRDRMRACVVWSEQPLDREVVPRLVDGKNASCKYLEPAP
jgi:hypothetical protein